MCSNNKPRSFSLSEGRKESVCRSSSTCEFHSVANSPRSGLYPAAVSHGWYCTRGKFSIVIGVDSFTLSLRFPVCM